MAFKSQASNSAVQSCFSSPTRVQGMSCRSNGERSTAEVAADAVPQEWIHPGLLLLSPSALTGLVDPLPQSWLRYTLPQNMENSWVDRI